MGSGKARLQLHSDACRQRCPVSLRPDFHFGVFGGSFMNPHLDSPMSRALQALGLVALMLAASAVEAARYPANPAAGAGLVCLSDSGLVCVDADDLSARWRALADAHTLEPVIADGMVLVGGGAGLHAFDAATGEARWQWRGEGLVFSPTVAGETVYVSDQGGRLAALELATGAPRWQRDLGGWSYPPAVLAGRLVTGGRDGVVRALDRASGGTLWRYDAGQELVYRPVAAGGRAIVTTFAGAVIALEPDGSVAWRASDPVPSFSPARAGPLLLFGGMDGRLRARRVADGTRVWEFRAAGQLAVPARHHAASGRVALVDPDGHAVVLDRADGRMLARVRIPGAPLGGPLHRPGSGWIVPYRADGTVGYLSVSQAGADE